MRNNRSVFGILAAMAIMWMTAPVDAAEKYQVDPAHTYVLFKVMHLGVGYSYGRFDSPTGSIVWDEANPANSTIAIAVDAASINTAVEKRDQHIRSADFLNSGKYTTIAFKSTSVAEKSADTYAINGELTLLGKTRPISIEARQTGNGKDPWGNYRRGFKSIFVIKRSDWGMDFMLGGLGDEVELTVSVEGVRK